MARTEATIRLKPEVMWREVEGEIIVLDSSDWTYLGVNDSGAALWPLVVDGTTHALLVERLRSLYDIPTDMAERDVRAFVGALSDLGLLGDDHSAS